ncbi:MAG: hypothetical protein LBG22_04205 [Treponema sp.]|jgi:hypothetical protein|nr:hypothetical protein [Treponema sp.]
MATGKTGFFETFEKKPRYFQLKGPVSKLKFSTALENISVFRKKYVRNCARIKCPAFYFCADP